jgi:hypothetical protein
MSHRMQEITQRMREVRLSTTQNAGNVLLTKCSIPLVAEAQRVHGDSVGRHRAVLSSQVAAFQAW